MNEGSLVSSERGAVAQRLGYACALLSFALVPVHFFVPCQVSVAIGASGLLLFLATALSWFFVPRGAVARSRPVALGLVGFAVHLLSTH